jgi:hypothetical protein
MGAGAGALAPSKDDQLPEIAADAATFRSLAEWKPEDIVYALQEQIGHEAEANAFAVNLQDVGPYIVSHLGGEKGEKFDLDANSKVWKFCQLIGKELVRFGEDLRTLGALNMIGWSEVELRQHCIMNNYENIGLMVRYQELNGSKLVEMLPSVIVHGKKAEVNEEENDEEEEEEGEDQEEAEEELTVEQAMANLKDVLRSIAAREVEEQAASWRGPREDDEIQQIQDDEKLAKFMDFFRSCIELIKDDIGNDDGGWDSTDLVNRSKAYRAQGLLGEELKSELKSMMIRWARQSNMEHVQDLPGSEELTKHREQLRLRAHTHRCTRLELTHKELYDDEMKAGSHKKTRKIATKAAVKGEGRGMLSREQLEKLQNRTVASAARTAELAVEFAELGDQKRQERAMEMHTMEEMRVMSKIADETLAFKAGLAYSYKLVGVLLELVAPEQQQEVLHRCIAVAEELVWLQDQVAVAVAPVGAEHIEGGGLMIDEQHLHMLREQSLKKQRQVVALKLQQLQADAAEGTLGWDDGRQEEDPRTPRSLGGAEPGSSRRDRLLVAAPSKYELVVDLVVARTASSPVPAAGPAAGVEAPVSISSAGSAVELRVRNQDDEGMVERSWLQGQATRNAGAKLFALSKPLVQSVSAHLERQMASEWSELCKERVMWMDLRGIQDMNANAPKGKGTGLLLLGHTGPRYQPPVRQLVPRWWTTDDRFGDPMDEVEAWPRHLHRLVNVWCKQARPAPAWWGGRGAAIPQSVAPQLSDEGLLHLDQGSTFYLQYLLSVAEVAEGRLRQILHHFQRHRPEGTVHVLPRKTAAEIKRQAVVEEHDHIRPTVASSVDIVKAVIVFHTPLQLKDNFQEFCLQQKQFIKGIKNNFKLSGMPYEGTAYRDVVVYVDIPAVQPPPFRVGTKVYDKDEVRTNFICEIRFALCGLFALQQRLHQTWALRGAPSINDLVSNLRAKPPGLIAAEVEGRDTIVLTAEKNARVGKGGSGNNAAAAGGADEDDEDEDNEVGESEEDEADVEDIDNPSMKRRAGMLEKRGLWGLGDTANDILFEPRYMFQHRTIDGQLAKMVQQARSEPVILKLRTAADVEPNDLIGMV